MTETDQAMGIQQYRAERPRSDAAPVLTSFGSPRSARIHRR